MNHLEPTPAPIPDHLKQQMLEAELNAYRGITIEGMTTRALQMADQPEHHGDIRVEDVVEISNLLTGNTPVRSAVDSEIFKKLLDDQDRASS